MKPIDKYKDIIAKTKQTHRDIQLEHVFDPDYIYKDINQQFIDEIRDHLSTCINRDKFTNVNWFKHPEQFTNVNLCNCYTHIETSDGLREFLYVIYSMYRKATGFNVDDILTTLPEPHHKK